MGGIVWVGSVPAPRDVVYVEHDDIMIIGRSENTYFRRL